MKRIHLVVYHASVMDIPKTVLALQGTILQLMSPTLKQVCIILSNFLLNCSSLTMFLSMKVTSLLCIWGVGGGGVMVFNATFNTISVISWWSVLMVEETGVPRENHRPAVSH